jgi:hypothetical protein
MQVLGTESFLATPDVNGQLVLLNGGGTGTVTYGTLAARPAASTAGNIYIDTTSNYIWQDTGAAWVQLSTGKVLQVVTGTIIAASGTTTVPLDSTSPTITEGWQIFTQAFTPLSATSTIKIEFTITSSHSAATGTNILSLFAGTTNLASVAGRTDSTANTATVLSINEAYLPGSTAAITFSARLGNPTAGSSICNRVGTNTLGGSLVSTYTITEIQ